MAPPPRTYSELLCFLIRVLGSGGHAKQRAQNFRDRELPGRHTQKGHFLRGTAPRDGAACHPLHGATALYTGAFLLPRLVPAAVPPALLTCLGSEKLVRTCASGHKPEPLLGKVRPMLCFLVLSSTRAFCCSLSPCRCSPLLVLRDLGHQGGGRSQTEHNDTGFQQQIAVWL